MSSIFVGTLIKFKEPDNDDCITVRVIAETQDHYVSEEIQRRKVIKNDRQNIQMYRHET